MSIELIRYLGDGVYAEFDPSSCNMTLRTGSHHAHEADNTIVLEPAVIAALAGYVKQIHDLEEDAYAKLLQDQDEPRIQPHVARNERISEMMDRRGPGERNV